jgi:lipoprotein-anchoring transpeptidase ErfK/SrfK
MRRAAVSFVLLAAALLPAAANAQAPAAGAPAQPAQAPAQPAQAPPAAPPAAPLEAAMTLRLDRVGGTRRTVLARTRVRVTGAVSAYAADETITVRFYMRGRKVRVKQVRLQQGRNGQGFFLLGHKTTGVGRLVVRAEHTATAALGTFKASSFSVNVLPRSVGQGSGRASVSALQNRLGAKGYVVGQRGHYDARTQRAVLAFRKVTGMARTSSASKQVMSKIAVGGGTFRMRFRNHGRHIEADLSRQVLVLIDGGKVRRIYPMSSGKPSTPTVVGSFRVYSKTPGTNAKGMVDSSYFIRGYAVHGYPSVPIYAASHGCLRVPIPEARSIFNWVVIGTPVDVYT